MLYGESAYVKICNQRLYNVTSVDSATNALVRVTIHGIRYSDRINKLLFAGKGPVECEKKIYLSTYPTKRLV